MSKDYNWLLQSLSEISRTILVLMLIWCSAIQCSAQEADDPAHWMMFVFGVQY